MQTKIQFRTRYSKPVRVTKDFDLENEPSQTKQSFAQECDINWIMKKGAEAPEALAHLIKENPQYGDFSDTPTYQDAMNVVALANAQFAALSSETRDRFNNDPSKFLTFVHDKNNVDEMVKMGLMKRVDNTPPEDLLSVTKEVRDELRKTSTKTKATPVSES